MHIEFTIPLWLLIGGGLISIFCIGVWVGMGILGNIVGGLIRR